MPRLRPCSDFNSGTPSVTFGDSSPFRGASARAYAQRKINATSLPNLRHSEEGEARRGNPHPLMPHSDNGQSQGETDCHVATLLAMTGQLRLPRRFGQCREALPLLGEVPSAHTGARGRRGIDRGRREKTERSADQSFRPSPSYVNPSVTFGDSSPFMGAKGAACVQSC